MESGKFPVAFKAMFKTTDWPGDPDPEDRLNPTPWAKVQAQAANMRAERRKNRDSASSQYDI